MSTSLYLAVCREWAEGGSEKHVLGVYTDRASAKASFTEPAGSGGEKHMCLDGDHQTQSITLDKTRVFGW